MTITLPSMTDQIFETTAPYNHSAQGEFTRLLFVCSAGILRSATGANYYAKLGYNTRCCGTADFALIPLSVNLIQWADRIVFVNRENYREAVSKFSRLQDITLKLSKSIVLDIPDVFDYNDPSLIFEFKTKLSPVVPEVIQKDDPLWGAEFNDE